MKPKRPIEFSYKVADHFFAGEYPFEKLPKDGLPKLQKLLDAGIKHFIDLTRPQENLTSYVEHLPREVSYRRIPVLDMSVPDFETLRIWHDFIARREDYPVYLHCKGGYDRTSVVVATYFIFIGKTVAQAKRRYYQVADKMRTRYSHTPLIETKWKVLEEYEQFLKDFFKPKVPVKNNHVEINHHAVRTLWEGLNAEQDFRRVLYLPYVDGYVTLLVTDADGKTIRAIRDTDISKQYFPEKYNDDLPLEYRRIVSESKNEKKLAYTKYGGAELAQFLPFARFEGKKYKYVVTISVNKPLAAVDIFVNGIDVLVDGVTNGKIIQSVTIQEMIQGFFSS